MQKISVPLKNKQASDPNSASSFLAAKPTGADHLFMPEDHMEALYVSLNPFVRFVHQNRIESIAKELPQKSGLKILDAGCGEGHLLETCFKKYSGNQYYGIDITEIALEKARKRCSLSQFKRANLSSIGFESEFFDVVMCTEVIEHVIDYQVVLNELKRALKKGGFFLITFPNEFLWTVSRFVLRRDPVKVPDHVNSFNPSQMKSHVNLEMIKQIQLPFNLPFFMSLGSLMKFKK